MDRPGSRLDSWKAIADYLRRDRTTVMRWERTAALPVRRVHGGRGHSVFAYTEDIDRWLAGERSRVDGVVPPAEPGAGLTRDRSRWAQLSWRSYAGLLAALVVVVISGFGVKQLWGAPVVASVSLAGREIIAADSSGREIWRYLVPDADATIVPARFLIADVDDDRRPDVLAALHFMRPGRHGYGAVLLLDDRGRLRWQRTLDDSYRFGDIDYGPVWYPNDIFVYRSNGAARIAVPHHHHTWWPSVLVVFDARGQAISRFVNAGWIHNVTMTADGRYLLAAGISNSLGGAVLAALDPAHPGGTSPAGADWPACANCPPEEPAAYFVAPWTDLARPSDTPAVVVQVTDSGAVEWHAVQRGQDRGKVPDVIITLSPALDVVRRAVNDYFNEAHAALRKTGGPAAGAALWQEAAIRRWTPAAGWQALSER